MTNKIKLTKEQSNGLEVIKKLYSIDNILKTHAKADEGAWTGNAEDVNDLSLSDLATALINGYEVEMTPHEVIAVKYNTSQDDYVYNQCPHSKGFAEGIEFTLNTLGITTKGVNDK